MMHGHKSLELRMLPY